MHPVTNHGFGKLKSSAFLPPKPPLHRPPQRAPAPHKPTPVRVLLDRLASGTNPSNTPRDGAIVIPLNYAHLLGLRGREIYLDPMITAAHDDVFTNELDPSYSSVSRLGKEKLLYAAREGLRAVRGRASLVHPDIHIEPALLPGALALLEQSGQYELVIQLAQQASRINLRSLRPAPSRATLRDYERDIALATALAHCGLAKGALEAGQVALGCARLDEALHILQEAISVGEPPLAADLQSQITTAIADMKADAVLDYLRQPLDLAEVALRQQALTALSNMMQQRIVVSKDKNKGKDEGGGRQEGGLSIEYVSKALAALTCGEICDLLDWDRLAKDASFRSALPWWQEGVLPQAGLTHLVAGFVHRKPALVEIARRLLAAGRSEGDVAVPMAVCEVLLGQPIDALDILKEDEKLGASLRSKAGLGGSSSAINAGRRGTMAAAAAAAGAAPPFPDRDGVMAFIRGASPDGEGDLLPGLCLFVEQWLPRLAFPNFRDTYERPPSASLSDYFEDKRTAAYLEGREKPSLLRSFVESLGGVGAGLQGWLNDRKAALEEATRTAGQRQATGVLGVAALLAAVGIATGGFGLTARRRATAQAPGGVATALALTPNRGVDVERQKNAATTAVQSGDAGLSKETVKQLVRAWLVRQLRVFACCYMVVIEMLRACFFFFFFCIF
jgi:tetratricopeptide (TPR) repeat protein